MYIFSMICLQFLVNFNGQFCNTQLSQNPPLPISTYYTGPGVIPLIRRKQGSRFSL